MIDPLLNIAMPQTGPSTASQDPAPGTPSFLPWMQPEQDDAGPTNGLSGLIDPFAEALMPHQVSAAPASLAPIPWNPIPSGLMSSDPLLASHAHLMQGASLDVPATNGKLAVDQPVLLSDSTRVVLDATRWRDFAATVLELHICNPQGEREVVAMPWRLMASGHFAHADAISAMPGQGSITAFAAARVGLQAASAGAASALWSVSHGASLPRVDGKGAVVEASISRASNHPRDDVAALKTMSSHAPAAAEWLARWMKWIERDGRDVVVWLRDYSIDEDQAARFVDGLRSFAQAQGVGLERIVVNGRELWRNPQSTTVSRKKE